MSTKKAIRYICCLLATILCFLGMSVELTNTDSTFLCALEYSNTSHISMISADTGVTENVECTLNMLKGSHSLQNAMSNTASKVRIRTFVYISFCIATVWYLSISQKTECKENFEHICCKSVAVDYIHRKDSGE